MLNNLSGRWMHHRCWWWGRASWDLFVCPRKNEIQYCYNGILTFKAREDSMHILYKEISKAGNSLYPGPGVLSNRSSIAGPIWDVHILIFSMCAMKACKAQEKTQEGNVLFSNEYSKQILNEKKSLWHNFLFMQLLRIVYLRIISESQLDLFWRGITRFYIL